VDSGVHGVYGDGYAERKVLTGVPR